MIRIAGNQVVSLVFTIYTTAILFPPAITAQQAGNDAVISWVIAWVVGFSMAWILVALTRRHPYQTIVEYSETLLGKQLGKVVGLLYAFYFLHVAAGVARQAGELMILAFMPETPLIIFLLMLVAASAYSVRSGVEVMARVGEIVFPLILVAFVFIFAAEVKDISLDEMLPIFAQGMGKPLEGSLVPMGFFAELAVLGMLLPLLNDQGWAFRSATAVTLVLGVLTVLLEFLELSIFGARDVARMTLPPLELVKLIQIGRFLERVESILAAAWLAAILLKLTLFHYATTAATAQVFGIRDTGALVLPIGLLVVTYAMVFEPDLLALIDFIRGPFVPYSLFHGLFLPLFLLLLSLARRGGTAANEHDQPRDVHAN